MSKINIITNNHHHYFKYAHDVPSAVMSDFDWLDEEENMDGFIQYKGIWYHLSGFMKIDSNGYDFDDWHGYIVDSAFSGVLIKLSDDGESYQIATYCC